MAMAGERLLVHCLAVMLLIALVEGATNEPTICNIALTKLKLCRPAVTGKYPPPPTKECCSLMKQANLTCLCKFKEALPAFEIDPARAFALPKKCNLRTPPQCKV
ncbi:putative lipid-transfer protein DIR1 [Herrania umbratica]|uniref:Lipid-transfer protein DIR1 n=1 Tax=Herrania umbratica TaxID=108875 RepID=A0A6J1AM00_9ROSI|nr:putative lipid-transfer protein DIR1 [Herrania umbratica]